VECDFIIVVNGNAEHYSLSCVCSRGSRRLQPK
jgi:hypothetical protein